MTPRWGMTIPFDTVPLTEHAVWLGELADLGYTDVWSAEAVDDVPRAIAEVKAGAAQAGRPDPEIAARIFVCPAADAEQARRRARMAIAAYLTVPAYAAFHEWLGRGEALRGLWDNWAAGDRRAALAAIPDGVTDDLVTWGEPEHCRERVARYARAGITTPIIALLPGDYDLKSVIRGLAPR